MAVIIIACEVGFWVLVLAGLIARYMFRQPKLGWSLLLLTPVVDLLLLIVTALDLKNGAEASFVHGIAAIYIGVSIAYGHKMIGWADKQFAYRFANGPAPSKPPKYGADHATHERRGWLSHLLAWIIGAATLYGIILFVGDGAQTEPLMQCIRVWGIILIIDFAYSFSFTLWPRKDKKPIG